VSGLSWSLASHPHLTRQHRLKFRQQLKPGAVDGKLKLNTWLNKWLYDVEWIAVAQDGHQWRNTVNSNKHCVTQKTGWKFYQLNDSQLFRKNATALSLISCTYAHNEDMRSGVPLILNLDHKLIRQVFSTYRPHTSGDKFSVPNEYEAWCAPEPVWKLSSS
jgi:hypothetical protein